MEHLSGEQILQALQALSRQVDIEDARLLMRKLAGDRDGTWQAVEPFLVPGRELTARLALDDPWESEHGSG